MNTTTVDGRPALRFERHLRHGQEKVWRAVTEPAQLSRWYPFPATELEPRVGGRIVFDDGEGTTLTGTVTHYEPPHLFAFDEHDPQGGEREFDDHLRIELHPEGEGCLLVFTHVFTDSGEAQGYATGWEACLEQLVTGLDATDPGAGAQP